jgi:oligogalacturonide transport system permease protein
MLVQFLRNIPRDLDEAAKIDGCNAMQILVKIIVPMLMPAIVSCCIIQVHVVIEQLPWAHCFMLISLQYYPATIFVKLSMDSDAGFNWNRVLAISLISILPNITMFFLAQNQFVDGISAGGVKG